MGPGSGFKHYAECGQSVHLIISGTAWVTYVSKTIEELPMEPRQYRQIITSGLSPCGTSMNAPFSGGWHCLTNVLFI